MNYLVCRKNDCETRILIDEIKAIIMDSLQVSITTYLIYELLKRNVKIIFIDNKHNPIGEVLPYQYNSYSYRHIKEQIAFDDCSKNYLWKLIIKEKILNQSKILLKLNKTESYNKLQDYYEEVDDNDVSNREGHAAKVYFNSIFGLEFSRDKDCDINKYLNYGYSIILSAINREIVSHGYLPEIGIHHIGESNPFNLGCDLMEPMRQIIDSIVLFENLDSDNYSLKLVSSLQKTVKYNEKDILLENAIHLYVEDIFSYLNTGDIDKIKFIKYEI